MNDRARLVAGGGVRAVATGMMGISMGVYLATLGLSPDQIGAIVSAGLAGQVGATVLVTFGGHLVGRRRALIAVALLGVVGSIAATVASGAAWLALAAGVGMLNGMGRDRGAASVVEQAALPATTTDSARTRAFAIYHLVQDAGAFAGSLLAGLPAIMLVVGVAEDSAWEGVLVLHGALMGAAALLYAGLSEEVEGSAARGPSTRGAGRCSSASAPCSSSTRWVVASSRLRSCRTSSSNGLVWEPARSPCSSARRASPTRCRTSAPPGSRVGSGS